MIYLNVAVGLIWGAALGFVQFDWLYKSTKKAIDAGRKPIMNPLRMILVVAGLFLPALIHLIFPLYDYIPAFLASFGGFVIGFALWWFWFKIKRSSGGN
ncbi:MAG TPA: hypothetical protein PKV16_00785 [Caldisericia bacterium]|nr:hypothetical protein [Caldisericia bacterium]HPF49052.1 hypothetical protein [Caldisericia bacterium]HPI83084.1 hypothetical protein [Caldisericia bacterium]HPQ92311.1 hypothetical protein [Caldisericia bacterium]HRV74591.1 hypothetical protein [Caldisericia bacterium]